MFVAPPIRIGLYEFDRMVAMNWIVFHIVSGHAFFSGILLLFIAVLVSISKRPFINRFTALAFLFGIIAIVLSSTPLPPWVYLVAAVATLLWIASRYSDPLRRWTPGAMIAVWLMAAGIEIPYHRIQPLALASNRSLQYSAIRFQQALAAQNRPKPGLRFWDANIISKFKISRML